MGTGSGIQAITAGQTALNVIAVDINPEAVRFAKRNIIANGLRTRSPVVHSDLFSSLHSEDKFDVILFTPPYLKGTPKSDLDHALFDPKKNWPGGFSERQENIYVLMDIYRCFILHLPGRKKSWKYQAVWLETQPHCRRTNHFRKVFDL